MDEAYDLLSSKWVGHARTALAGGGRSMQDDVLRPAASPASAASPGPASSATPVAVNVGSSARSGGDQIDDAEREQRKRALDDLLDIMRPAVQADGGDLAVVEVDYDAGVVEVQLQGACGSCAISAVTLQGGVERLLKERLPWVSEVRGGVDESVDPFESAAMGRGGYIPRWE
jgi:Fe-S cluster biogenesis protein NfuA